MIPHINDKIEVNSSPAVVDSILEWKHSVSFQSPLKLGSEWVIFLPEFTTLQYVPLPKK